MVIDRRVASDIYFDALLLLLHIVTPSLTPALCEVLKRGH